VESFNADDSKVHSVAVRKGGYLGSSRWTTRELRERHDAFLIRHCETVYAALSTDEKEHIEHLMRATLTKFELQQLERAKWQGTIYLGCRNRMMLNHNIVRLPTSLATVKGFLAGEKLEATSAEVRALIVGLAEELQLPVGP